MSLEKRTQKNIDRRRRSQPLGSRSRRGISTIETAVTLPLLAFLTFGSLELTNAIFLRQSVTLAAYEGARRLSTPGVAQDAAETCMKEVLTARGVQSFNIAVNPKVDKDTARGTMVSVTISADSSNISYAPFRIFSARTISGSTTMVRQ